MTDKRPTQLLMYRPHLDNVPATRPLPEGYEVRQFEAGDDIEALAETLTSAFAEEWSVERVKSSLTEASDVLAVYVVTWEGRPVATASSRLDPGPFAGSGYVHWVGAHADHAGRGLGTALMVRLFEDFRERGYPDAVLQTDDFRIPAIKSYLRCGFLPVYEVQGDDQRARWSAIFQQVLPSR